MTDHHPYWDSIYQNIQTLTVKNYHKFIIIKPYGIRFKNEICKHLGHFNLHAFKQISIPSWHLLALFLYIKAEFHSIDWEKRLFISRSFEQMEQNTASLLLLPEQVPFKKLAEIKTEIRQLTGSEKNQRTLANGQKILLTLNAVHTPDEDRLEYELKVLQYFLPQLTIQ